MSRATILVKKLNDDALLPQPMTVGSAGADCYANLGAGTEIIVYPGERVLVNLGFAAAVPPGYEMQIRPRSGIALKNGISLVNSPGTIDSDYRGPVGAIVINHDPSQHFVIKHGDRICQAVIAAVPTVGYIEVDELDTTERGEGGFGHTGK